MCHDCLSAKVTFASEAKGGKGGDGEASTGEICNKCVYRVLNDHLGDQKPAVAGDKSKSKQKQANAVRNKAACCMCGSEDSGMHTCKKDCCRQGLTYNVRYRGERCSDVTIKFARDQYDPDKSEYRLNNLPGGVRRAVPDYAHSVDDPDAAVPKSGPEVGDTLVRGDGGTGGRRGGDGEKRESRSVNCAVCAWCVYVGGVAIELSSPRCSLL